MKILIQNGRILDPASQTDRVGNLLIEDGVIVAHHADAGCEADRYIDAAGCYVMPGLIDLHVHLREPGFEYKETIRTGAMAAARGGYTTICPMPNTNPAVDSPEMIDWIRAKVSADAKINVLPIGAVTLKQEGLVLADITGMAESGAVAISEDGKSVMNANLYRDAMKMAKDVNLVVMAHCEDKELVNGGCMNQGAKAEELGLPGISNAVEDVITIRDILLAKETGVRLHLCHCSTKDSVDFVRWGKEQGLHVSAEVCPHHFAMADTEITGDDSAYKMNPPLRAPEDVQALKEALRDGIMDVIATDHAPHSADEKAKSMTEAPFGIVGLETAVALTITHLVEPGYLTPLQMAERMSYRPAQVIGIDKGTLADGACADITIIDPAMEYIIDKEEFVSKGQNTPFHGKTVRGQVRYTIVNGDIVFQNHN